MDEKLTLNQTLKFKKKDISKCTGLAEETIKYYTDQKIIIPEMSNPPGKESPKIYSLNNLKQFTAIRNLEEAGLDLRLRKAYLHKYRNHPEGLVIASGKIKCYLKRINNVQF